MAKSVPVKPIVGILKEEPKGMKVPNKQLYMDKEKLESEKGYRQHLAWLKTAQAQSREIHRVHQAAMDELAAETRTHRKKFIASNRAYANTLGKFDANRGAIRKIKY